MRSVQYLWSVYRRIGQVIIVAILGVGMWSPCAQAAITLQSFTPPVEVRFQGGDWTPVSASVELIDGDEISTGSGGTAELLFEDGSTLVLEQDTQLFIRDLEFSETEEVRVSRLKLLWGKIIGKATPLTYETNVFEVETNTAVAGFKFSGVTIETQPAGGSCGNIPGACTIFSDFEGRVDISSTGSGVTIVTLSPAGASGAAVTFSLPPGTTVNTQTDPGTGRISITSSGPLAQATVSLDSQYNTIEIENAPGNQPLNFTAGGHAMNMGPNSIATIRFAQSEASQQSFPIPLGSGTYSFEFGQDTTIPPGQMSVTAGQGSVLADGVTLTPGTTSTFDIIPSPAPTQERPEIPGIPPGPDTPPGADQPGKGKPTPTPTPTSTPTPEPPPPPPSEPVGSPITP